VAPRAAPPGTARSSLAVEVCHELGRPVVRGRSPWVCRAKRADMSSRLTRTAPERSELHAPRVPKKTQTTVGRKVGFRIVMLAQRFEARPSVGDYTRDQFAPSVSFRVPADSLAMLHGDEAAAP
jgi:hypothetical protein